MFFILGIVFTIVFTVVAVVFSLQTAVTATLVVFGFGAAAWLIEHIARKHGLDAPEVRYTIEEEDLMNPHWSNRIEPGALQPGARFSDTQSGKNFKVVERLEQVNTDVGSPSTSAGWTIELEGTGKRQFLSDATFVAMSTSNIVVAL